VFFYTRQHNEKHKSMNYGRSGECGPVCDDIDCRFANLSESHHHCKSSVDAGLWAPGRCYKSLVVILIGRRTHDVVTSLSVKP